MKIGPMELVVIFIVALLVIGPNKLPDYAKKLGQAMREFTKATEGFTEEIKKDVIDPLEEVQKPLKDAVAPITEMEQELRSSVQEVKTSVDQIGKEKPSEDTQESPEAETAAEPTI